MRVLDFKKKIYKNVYIPAYPDDTGVSIGAAYLANYKFNKKIKSDIDPSSKLWL